MSAGGLLSTMFPTIMAGLGLAAADLGRLVTANKLTGAVLGPLWVVLAGRWSRKGVLVTAAGLAGLATVTMGFADGLIALLVLSCVLAAVYSGTVPVTTSILADLFEDRSRGRAIGAMYASISLLGAASGTLVGQLSRIEDGWRVGYWALGGLGILVGLLILVLFRDPGVGATEAASARPAPLRPKLTAAAAMEVFRVPSFNVMLLSRLLSGHLVIGSFGILFLTSVRHFSNAEAALVLLPFGAGYCLGTTGGAAVADWMHARDPGRGRVLFLQSAQFGFAAVAFLATQVAWEGIRAYMAFWLILGLLQGVNPGVNRPIVMSVIPPELRGWAFVVMLSIVEPVAWAAFSFGVSRFGEGEGLRTAFLVLPVCVMTLNGLALSLLYRFYPRDSARARAGWGAAVVGAGRHG